MLDSRGGGDGQVRLCCGTSRDLEHDADYNSSGLPYQNVRASLSMSRPGSAVANAARAVPSISNFKTHCLYGRRVKS